MTNLRGRKTARRSRIVYADDVADAASRRATPTKYRERITKLRQIVTVHQKNVSALEEGNRHNQVTHLAVGDPRTGRGYC